MQYLDPVPEPLRERVQQLVVQARDADDALHLERTRLGDLPPSVRNRSFHLFSRKPWRAEARR